MNLLRTRGLEIVRDGHVLCRSLDMDISGGESWAVVGPNGAGKTSLLHCLAGLAKPRAGQIEIDGDALQDLEPLTRARRVGLLLQQGERGFPATVFEFVLAGRYPHLGQRGWEGAEDLQQARAAIRAMGLQTLEQRDIGRLSGGEMRRAEIARLLCQSPRLALADEPLNHLDARHRGRAISALRESFVSTGRALVMVLHDLDMAFQACDNWLLMLPGGGWQSGPASELADPDRLSGLFGQRIIRLASDDGEVLVADQRSVTRQGPSRLS